MIPYASYDRLWNDAGMLSLEAQADARVAALREEVTALRERIDALERAMSVAVGELDRATRAVERAAQYAQAQAASWGGASGQTT